MGQPVLRQVTHWYLGTVPFYQWSLLVFALQAQQQLAFDDLAALHVDARNALAHGAHELVGDGAARGGHVLDGVALAKNEGVELTDEQLEAISGGGNWLGCWVKDCKDFVCKELE